MFYQIFARSTQIVFKLTFQRLTLVHISAVN